MKKILFVLLVVLCSCKSITYKDVTPDIAPNDKLLPALEPVVDVYNLEAVYSAGGAESSADTYYNMPANANWSSSSSANITYYKDSRVRNAINIFNKEVKENITNPFGKKKGYIVLRLGYRGVNDNSWLFIPSMVTVFTANLVGFPVDYIKQSQEVEVEIYNNKKELVKRYGCYVSSQAAVAMWWGYGSNIWTKLAADNIKEALSQIRFQIGDEADDIIDKLN